MSKADDLLEKATKDYWNRRIARCAKKRPLGLAKLMEHELLIKLTFMDGWCALRKRLSKKGTLCKS